MINGAQTGGVFPAKQKRDPVAAAQARNEIELACNDYVEEPCAFKLEELQEALNRAKTVAEHIDWKKFVLRTYQIELK